MLSHISGRDLRGWLFWHDFHTVAKSLSNLDCIQTNRRQTKAEVRAKLQHCRGVLFILKNSYPRGKKREGDKFYIDKERHEEAFKLKIKKQHIRKHKPRVIVPDVGE